MLVAYGQRCITHPSELYFTAKTSFNNYFSAHKKTKDTREVNMKTVLANDTFFNIQMSGAITNHLTAQKNNTRCQYKWALWQHQLNLRCNCQNKKQHIMLYRYDSNTGWQNALRCTGMKLNYNSKWTLAHNRKQNKGQSRFCTTKQVESRDIMQNKLKMIAQQTKKNYMN